ncbi:MAG: HEAT repeat domain-containing protein [Gemmatimonadales bacterium]
MPVEKMALFATGIYQQGLPQRDPDAEDRTIALLARAAAEAGLRLETAAATLIIDTQPVPLSAPGASLVRQSLEAHHTARLQLPPHLDADQWRAAVAVYAAAPGCYRSADDVRDALRVNVPDAQVSASGGVDEGDLRDALFEMPGLRAATNAEGTSQAIAAQNAELQDFERRLDELLRTAEEARDHRAYQQLATALLGMVELAAGRGDEMSAIVARERRRVVSAATLDELARAVARPETPIVVTRALHALGREGAAALLTALTGARGPERRAYVDALAGCRDVDGLLLEALSNARRELVRDAALLLGRRQVERAVPQLATLLKQSQVEVRTAAWHALEMIGTREALKVLRT